MKRILARKLSSCNVSFKISAYNRGYSVLTYNKHSLLLMLSPCFCMKKTPEHVHIRGFVWQVFDSSVIVIIIIIIN